MKLKALLIDDEFSAIRTLNILLKKHCPTIEVVATANSVDEAITAINIHTPDVVFLDIEMPQKSGFELFNETDEKFQTIFVTAYDEYAIRAFDVSAVDYLLKPIKTERLKQAVNRLAGNEQQDFSVLNKVMTTGVIDRITIRNNNIQEVVKIEDIVCMRANTVYTTIYFEKNHQLQTTVYSKPLSYFEELIEGNTNFFRTHRSWLINLKKIISFNKKDLSILLKFEIEVSVSKLRKKVFFNLLK